MKFLLTFTLAFTFLIKTSCIAQDVIYKTSGDEIKAKVTEITLTDILFRHPDSLQGPTLSVAKADVFMIKYANGSTELIKLSLTSDTLSTISPESQNPKQMYLKGRADARKHYKARGVFWGSAAAGAASLFTGGATLAVPVVLAVTPPSPGSMRVPDPNLIRNPDYMYGYKKQARKRKIGKAAAGAGTGIVTGAALVLAIVIAIFI